MICIESVVQQRFPGLIERKPLLGNSLLRFLRFICHESHFQRFESQYPHLEGFDFIEQVLHYFEFSFRVKDSEWERIPAQGRVVIVANHPIGSLDGLALLKMLGEVRRDVKVVANEILSAIKPLQSLLLPVDNMQGRSGKNQLQSIREHLNNEGAVIIFPAGEVSRIGPRGIRDGVWNTGFIRFAKRTKAPILPVFVDGRNSIFFYSLSLLAKPISTLWLIREMFKQAHNDLNITVGHLIHPEQYNTIKVNNGVLARMFKKAVYGLPKKHRQAAFANSYEAIAHPEDRRLLKKEIRQCERLGQTNDGKIIYLFRYQCNSVVMREVGRLRELTFRAVKEGTGKRRDTDYYDSYYDHIVLWDEHELEIVGAYRLVPCQRALSGFNEKNSAHFPPLYSQSLFRFEPAFDQYLPNGLELGRSFVQPRYWGKRSIDYLWQGIGAYLVNNPDIRYLFGPVSISHDYPEQVKNSLVDFYSRYFGGEANVAKALNPFVMTGERNFSELTFSGENYREDFCRLKSFLAAKSVSIPTLYKQYTELCEPGGAQFLAFNVDKDFADCIDGLILIDLHRVKADKRNRYLQVTAVAS